MMDLNNLCKLESFDARRVVIAIILAEIYYLLTESEVITGKSQTEVLAVRTERSEVRTNKTEV